MTTHTDYACMPSLGPLESALVRTATAERRYNGAGSVAFAPSAHDVSWRALNTRLVFIADIDPASSGTRP